ncbi:LPXTG cell wall anchor domain-containing protein [Leucobacter chromiireducens]|uniref:LPXTG cell wall anchor domain-containing protein n=1 Tax=Leucobacter chromiireducens TaxID=283877 RepID=UPI003F7F0FEA
MHARTPALRRLAQAALGAAVCSGLLLAGTGAAHADTGVDASAPQTISGTGIPELGGAESAGWFLVAGAAYLIAGGVLYARRRRAAALSRAYPAA